MPSIGPLELVIILVIVLLILGPKRLPALGRQLGSGMREFKDGITGRHGGDDEADDAPALTAAPAEPAPPAKPTAAAAEPRPDDRPPADA